MKLRGRLIWAMLGGLGCGRTWGQTHVVKKPETVVRAVAVYEWTGEEGKATASRVVPVSVFINGKLEDAGVYLARPVPFALDTGTVFEVEKAGVPEGSVELAYTRHYLSNGGGAGSGTGGASGPGGASGAGSAIDDGWVAYGALKLKPGETAVAVKKGGPLPQVEVSGGKRPHFSDKDGSGGAGSSKGDTGATNGTDTKKPVDRSGAAGAGTTVSAEDDADRPTVRRRDTEGSSKDSSGGSKAGTDSDSAKDDPDRPTLKKRTPADVKAAAKKKDTASVTGSGSLNDDPDRPVLHRGVPASATDEEHLPPLHGLPKDMRQRVAISDARDRPEHEFARRWESNAERVEVTAKLEEVARAKLAEYGVGGAAGVSPAAGPVAPTPAAKASVAGKAPARAAAASKMRRSVAPVAKSAAAKPAGALTEESVQGYTLSYGGAATYVLTASSPGVGGAVRYVTVVAQREPLGQLKVALASVTDSKHLDRVPWMRLVDAVDAEASNRASLLFELRGETSRQFGLYRVIGAVAEQTFLTAVPE